MVKVLSNWEDYCLLLILGITTVNNVTVKNNSIKITGGSFKVWSL